MYDAMQAVQGAGLLKAFDMIAEIVGQPWVYRGGILVGFLEL
jgi:hypothetical protein